MSDLRSRIKTIEKNVIPQPTREIIPIMTKAWKVGDKVFYFDLKGQEREYIEADNKEHPIFTFLASKKEVMANQGEGIPHN